MSEDFQSRIETLEARVRLLEERQRIQENAAVNDLDALDARAAPLGARLSVWLRENPILTLLIAILVLALLFAAFD